MACFQVIVQSKERKNNLPNKETRLFDALLVKADGAWYVDPDSMRNSTAVPDAVQGHALAP